MGLMSVMADIWRSRSRSALTMSAVAIGIFFGNGNIGGRADRHSQDKRQP